MSSTKPLKLCNWYGIFRQGKFIAHSLLQRVIKMIKATQVKEVQVKKIRPGVARAQLGLTQVELAERSGISYKTIGAGENGAPIRLLSAVAILEAINQERIKRGMEPLDFEEVDWN